MKHFYQLLLLILGGILISCSSDNDTQTETISILGTWNLIAYNDNPDEVYCPKILEITTDIYTETEFGGSACDDEYSFSRNYMFDGTAFKIINPDVQNTNFTIISLTENELTWETITPNANQVLSFTYEKIE